MANKNRRLETDTLINQLLDKSGLTLRSLADYLDVNFTVLSRYNLGKKTLPAPAIQKLVAFYTNVKDVPATMPVLSPQDAVEYLQHANFCLAKCKPLRKKLNELKTQYTQATNMLVHLQKTTQPLTPPSVKEQRWEEEQRMQAASKIDLVTAAQIKKIELKIMLLQYEALIHQQAIAL